MEVAVSLPVARQFPAAQETHDVAAVKAVPPALKVPRGQGKAVAEREAGVKAGAATAVAVMGVVATEGGVKAEGAREEEATASFLARRCVCP